VREKYCWLVAGGWFVLREKYCWLVADKPNEQADDCFRKCDTSAQECIGSVTSATEKWPHLQKWRGQ
jgi:hypothetical protein